MRYALSGSALVHAAIFGTALIGFAWPQPEDAPAPGAITVDIVNVSSVLTNSTQTLTSSAPQNLVSAGTEASSPVLQPIKPERTIASVAPTAKPVTPVEQTEILTTAMLSPEPTNSIAAASAEPVTATQPIVVEPQSVTDAKAAPIPHTLSFERPSVPTAQQEPTPKRQQRESQAGNGGQNQADAAASASAGQNGNNGSGGNADTASWERQVQRRLAGALRYPRGGDGARGEVMVRFTVAAQGDASGMQVIGSSGNPILDQAALDTVARAAPFPPIPAGAGFTSKTFDFPLGFVRN